MIASLHRRNAVALADLPGLRGAARRTSLVRVALALGLAATLAALFLSARSAGSGRAAVFPAGASTGVVTLDMSASISGGTYARVATTLRGIVDANQAIGLVMFSDSAYELLPPNSPPGALLQFTRFFRPVRYYRNSPVFGQSPWDTFMGGTRIATGLEASRLALRRAHVLHGAILLVSDLDDSAADQAALQQEALVLRTQHVPVRIVPLFPRPSNARLFTALFGPHALVSPSVFTHTATRRAQSVTAGHPWALLGLAAVLVLLLAANERWNTRLEVRAVPA
jgi:hypothetical protein